MLVVCMLMKKCPVIQNTTHTTQINVTQLTSPIIHFGEASNTNNQTIGTDILTVNHRSNNVYRNLVDGSKLTMSCVYVVSVASCFVLEPVGTFDDCRLIALCIRL